MTSVMGLRVVPFAAALAASTLAGCRGPARPSPVPAEAEAVSLFGTPLVPAVLSPESRTALEARLAAALSRGRPDAVEADGRRDRAVAVFRVVAGGDAWASFGAIAAEADLSRLGERPQPER